MSFLTQLTGAPDINLRKLARGDQKERDKAAAVVAEMLPLVMPQVDQYAEKWSDAFMKNLPVTLVRVLRDAADRRLGP